MNLLSSTSIFSFYTLISRLLGYIRDILIAIFLGASVYADAFFVAFRLPNTFRRLFAEGTFNAAFIPSYTSERVKSKKSAKKFADDVLAFLIIILLFIVLSPIFSVYPMTESLWFLLIKSLSTATSKKKLIRFSFIVAPIGYMKESPKGTTCSVDIYGDMLKSGNL